MRRACTIAILTFLATPASAERIPCLWNPFGGCSFSFVSPEYAKKPVQPLDPEAALAAINAFRAENGRKPLVLDERLLRADDFAHLILRGPVVLVRTAKSQSYRAMDHMSSRPRNRRSSRSSPP